MLEWQGYLVGVRIDWKVFQSVNDVLSKFCCCCFMKVFVGGCKGDMGKVIVGEQGMGDDGGIGLVYVVFVFFLI